MLKNILDKHNIERKVLAQAVLQDNGKPFSPALMSRLVNHWEFPKSSDPIKVRIQIEDFLLSRGVTQGEILEAYIGLPSNDAQLGKDRRNSMPKIALTQEASRRFSITRNPFTDDVMKASDVYVSQQQEYVYQTMLSTVRNNGFTAVIAERGAGKTLMMKKMFDQLKSQKERVILVKPRAMVGEDIRADKKRVTMSAVLDAIVFDTSSETPRMKAEHKARQVERLLNNLGTGTDETKNRVCIVIDGAHLLWKNTLKGLKRLRDMSSGFEPLIGVLLIGQPELADFLDERYSPDTAEVALRCVQSNLNLLNAQEMREYIALKFERVGMRPEQVLHEDAYAALHEKLKYKGESVAHPLLINNTLVAAMNYCAKQPAAAYKQVNAELLRGV